MAVLSLPQSVSETVEQLAAYYSHKDIEGLIAITSPQFTGFGSGPDEIVHSIEEFRTSLIRDFSLCDQVRMEFDDIHIREDIRAAWMIAACTITAQTGTDTIALKGRMSAVFRRVSSGWQIALTHFSMPYLDQEPGQSYPR